MWTVSISLFLILLHSNINRACNIEFNNLDAFSTIRNIYEQDIFNITGQLQYCPPSIKTQNVSIANPSLKQLSILNVSYFIETNQIQIISLARLIGFASLTIELYFEDQIEHRLIRRSIKNATAEQQKCSTSSEEPMNILQNCPTLKFKRGYYILKEEINIAVKRHQTVIDTLFTAVVMFLVTTGTLCIGCDLEIDQLLDNIKKPLPLIIGFTCQIIYIPLLSMLISKIFRLENATSLGLISTASCSGGGSSNIYTALLAGDVNLSVTITFFSTAFAFGTFPFWIWLFGKDHIDFRKTQFPWSNMILSLITLFIPALTGLLFRRYRLVLANRIGRFLNPIAVGYLVFILTFGVYINMYIFRIIDYKAIIACCFLPWFGFIGGAMISLIGIRDKKKTIAIAIETGVQNTAVAICFLRLTFPQPESDIALANPILVSMATPIPFLVLVLTKSILKKFPIFQKYLPNDVKKKTLEIDIKPEKLEKLIVKELLEKQQQEQSSQIQMVRL